MSGNFMSIYKLLDQNLFTNFINCYLEEMLTVLENIKLEFCSSKYTHDYQITKIIERRGNIFIIFKDSFVKNMSCQYTKHQVDR